MGKAELCRVEVKRDENGCRLFIRSAFNWRKHLIAGDGVPVTIFTKPGVAGVNSSMGSIVNVSSTRICDGNGGSVSLAVLLLDNLTEGVDVPLPVMSKPTLENYATNLKDAIKTLFVEHLKPFHISHVITMSTVEE